MIVQISFLSSFLYLSFFMWLMKETAAHLSGHPSTSESLDVFPGLITGETRLTYLIVWLTKASPYMSSGESHIYSAGGPLCRRDKGKLWKIGDGVLRFGHPDY